MNSPLPKWLQWLLPFFAIVSFGFTFWHLWEDRTASAGTAAAIGFGLLLFRILPDLESIQVLGMQAKLRQRLAEADELMDALRRVASSQSRVAVLSIAYSNRIGGMDWEEKDATYDDLMKQLSEIGIEQPSIDAIAEPYLRMASRDLLSIFTGVLNEVLPIYRRHHQHRLNTLIPSGKIPTEHDTLAKIRSSQEALKKLDHKTISAVFSSGDDYRDIERTCRTLLQPLKLVDEDSERLDRLLSELSELSKEIWKTKRIPSRTLKYLADLRSSHKGKFEEYFPDGAIGPKATY